MNAFNPEHFRQGTAPGLPVFDPARPPLRYDLAKAWRHFRRLMADKENTEEVFHIFQALPWKGLPAAAERFLTSPEGRALREAEPYLPPVLDDHATLRRMPVGSLAHAYCNFMEREGLTAMGLVEEFARFEAERGSFDDQFQWYFHRMRDTHDLLHVLTGYGRDALGETCVLAFTHGQQPAPAHLFIAYAGARELKTRTRVAAPVYRAVREGQKLGRTCLSLVESAITRLLPLPLDEVRCKLGISPPSVYRNVHAVWRTAGIDPYDVLGKAA